MLSKRKLTLFENARMRHKLRPIRISFACAAVLLAVVVGTAAGAYAAGSRSGFMLENPGKYFAETENLFAVPADNLGVATIKEVQHALKTIGFYRGALVFGADSTQPMTAFAPFETASLDADKIAAGPPLRGSKTAGNPVAKVVVPEIGSRSTESLLTLNRNDRAEIQLRLKLLGYDPKGVDGSFGPNSRAAISRWQQGQDFSQTGYLTRNQLTALKESSEAQYQEWRAANPNFKLRPRHRAKKCTNFLLFKACNTK